MLRINVTFQKISERNRAFHYDRTFFCPYVFIEYPNLYCQFYHRSVVACRIPNIFHFLPLYVPFKTLFPPVLRVIRYPTNNHVLAASPQPSLTLASINKGRRSKRGAGSRLSSESLRVVLRFPLRSTPRRPRVSVHAILVVPCVYIYAYIAEAVERRHVERERERGRPCRWKGSKRIGVRGLESCVEILVVVLRDSIFLYAVTTTALVSRRRFLLASQLLTRVVFSFKICEFILDTARKLHGR